MYLCGKHTSVHYSEKYEVKFGLHPLSSAWLANMYEYT